MWSVGSSDPISEWLTVHDLGLARELKGKEAKPLFIQKTCTTFKKLVLRGSG